MFQDEFCRLDLEENQIFGHEQLQKEIVLLSDSIRKLKAGEITPVIEELLPRIVNRNLICNFSLEVVQHFTEQICDSRKQGNLFWGRGRNVGCMELKETFQSLWEKNKSGGDVLKEITDLQKALESQKKILSRLIDKEIECIHTLLTQLKGIELSSLNERLKGAAQ